MRKAADNLLGHSTGYESALERVIPILEQSYGVTDKDIRNGKIGNVWSNIPHFVGQDVVTLLRMRQVEPGLMGIFSEAHVKLLSGDLLTSGITGDPLRLVTTREREDNDLFPDFGAIPWHVIVDLRSDRRVHSFRQKLLTLSQWDLRYADQKPRSLWREYVLDLEGLAGEVAPSSNTSALLGVLGNLPTAIPNPIGLYTAGLDFLTERPLS